MGKNSPDLTVGLLMPSLIDIFLMVLLIARGSGGVKFVPRGRGTEWVVLAEWLELVFETLDSR